MAEEADQTLRMLRKQQRGFEKEGRYIEADATRRRADKKFAAEETRRRETLSARQSAQRAAATSAFEQEREGLTRHWDFNTEQLEQQARQSELALSGRHSRKREQLQSHLGNAATRNNTSRQVRIPPLFVPSSYALLHPL